MGDVFDSYRCKSGRLVEMMVRCLNHRESSRKLNNYLAEGWATTLGGGLLVSWHLVPDSQ